MGYLILSVFIVCSLYVQVRGRVKHSRWTLFLSDHSNLLSPINCLFYAFSSIKNTPYVDTDNFQQLQLLEDNWQTIRDEALALNNQEHIKSADKLDDIGFNSFFKTGWKRFYLSWYGQPIQSAETLCPSTTALLKQIPDVKGAMFAMLPPGASLVKHRDPYAGAYRYHLGLQTPNSEDCFIEVDGERYFWKDGESVMFDETYIHYAQNNTSTNRIVLFLDIRRPVNFFLVDWVNTLFSKGVMASSAAKNIDDDKVGMLNRVFPYLYQIRKIGKRVKAFNKHVYYGIQVAGVAYIMYALCFS